MTLGARLFGSLYRKLAAVLLGVVLLLGTGVLTINVITTRLYVDEVEQRLNRELAAHLVAEQPLLVEGQVDEEGLKHVFHTLMVINPRIECYLLDPDGNILAYDAPEGHVHLERVDLEPIGRYLTGARPPIRGDDPRDPGSRKIFSAAPLPSSGGDAVAGYLYIVLAGEQYASIADRLGASRVLKLSLWTLGVAVLLAGLVGLMVFRLLTRRIHDLQQRMSSFEAGDFSEHPGPPGQAAWIADEIDQLDQTFDGMSKRIIQQVDGLRQLDSLRREMLTNISHDLRTPVSSLRGYLETLLLKEGTLAEQEHREYLEIALSQSERLGRLVDELFELARLDSGDVSLDMEPFSLAELVQDVTQKFAFRAAERQVRLETEIPESGFRVVGDLRLIERTLENLLENALRHTAPGGHISVSVLDRDRCARLSVSDDGCGIPPEEIPRIFERFYRGSTPRQPGSPGNGSAQEGTGLGLAIAKRVVELHHSHIDVDSRLGAGTTFAFDLASARAPVGRDAPGIF